MRGSDSKDAATALVVGICILLTAPAIVAQEGYYDRSVTQDRREIFDYLDELEEELGDDGFGDIPFDYATWLVERMGKLDRIEMTAGAFVEHIRSTHDEEDRFYPEKPLSNEEIKLYLLPLRLRYEPTSRPDWKRFLAERLEDTVGAADSASVAAERILGWIGSNITVIDEGEVYPLPLCGDLDTITTVRGRRGTEIDVAILAVGALRTFGVASRLAQMPAVEGPRGGKVWIEYLNSERQWIAWVPGWAAEDSGDHHGRISETFKGRAPVVFANIDVPVAITENYWPVVRLTSGPNPLGAEMQTSFHVIGDGMLEQAFGNNYRYFDGPHSQQFAPSEVWIGAGLREKFVGLQKIEFGDETQSWFIFDFSGKKIEMRSGPEIPKVFVELGPGGAP